MQCNRKQKGTVVVKPQDMFVHVRIQSLRLPNRAGTSCCTCGAGTGYHDPLTRPR